MLAQLGLLPEYLPIPYSVPGKGDVQNGGKLEYKLPVTGVETAQKLRDKEAVKSNLMLGFQVRSV